MRIFRLWIGIILVFILGVLAGSFGTGMYIQHRFERSVFDDGRPGRPPHPPMMHLLMRRLDHELDLNKTQRNEITKIMDQTLKKVHAIMEEKHPELEKMTQESLESIKDTLDPEQKEKLERLKLFEGMKERFQGKPPRPPHMGGREPHDIFADLRKSLQLTEAQEKEVKPIIEESLEQQRQMLETCRQQTHGIQSTMRNKMQGLQETVEKRLEKVLSAEQMDTYRRIQERRREMHEDMPPPGPPEFGGPPME